MYTVRISLVQIFPDIHSFDQKIIIIKPRYRREFVVLLPYIGNSDYFWVEK